MNPFDFVNAINTSKKDLMTGSENDELAEKAYVPYVVNRALSYFPETLLYANEMNVHHLIDNKLQFHYFLNNIRPGKRFSKWVKKEDSENLQAVMTYYGYGTEKAIRYNNKDNYRWNTQ
jgi:Bacteriophage clamp loader A subunit